MPRRAVPAAVLLHVSSIDRIATDEIQLSKTLYADLDCRRECASRFTRRSVRMKP